MSRKYSRSKGNHNFSTTFDANIKRSIFDCFYGVKTIFDVSKLILIYVDEVLSGDIFRFNMIAFVRIATFIKSVMDNLVFESFFFAVPNRLFWDNWEKFCGYQENLGDSTDFTVLMVTSVGAESSIEEGSLADYFGLPLNFLLGVDTGVSALLFRAYNKIWNEWFRDENFFDSIVLDTGDGPDEIENAVPFTRGKRKDYFIGCLSWPQKGEVVDLPLGTTAPVIGIGKKNIVFDQSNELVLEFTGETATYANSSLIANDTGPNVNDEFYVKGSHALVGNLEIFADLSSATGATINSLREAFQTQRLLERDACGGTRYIEVIRAYFNVTSPDFWLQRFEFLGGGRSHVNFVIVQQTESSQSGFTPQANLSAYGTVVATGYGFIHLFIEYMIIIGMVMVRVDLIYQQGINCMWLRQTRYDFFWPAFAHLGEQEVLSKEIYADGSAADLDIFGYQECYAEYRYKPSQITGKFRSTAV